MPAPKVRVERRDAITVLTLARAEVHNCMDAETADLISTAAESFASDPSARVLVVRGEGGRAFCAGADLRDIDGLMSRPDASRTGWLGFSWIDPGKPSVAAIEATASAAGSSSRSGAISGSRDPERSSGRSTAVWVCRGSTAGRNT